MSNPYKILQVDPEAEFEVIEAAYRRLARKYHPDVSDTPEARERMVALNRAWEELRTPDRRAAVDRARARAASAAAVAMAQSAAAARPSPQPASVADHRSHHTPSASAPGDGSLRAAAQPRPGEDLHHDRRRAGGAGGMGLGRPSDSEVWAGPPPGNASGSVLSFGRYRGWSLGEVARRDTEYLEWLERSPSGRPFRAELDALLRAGGHRGKP